MILQIDPSSGIAIYEQIVRQLKFAIANGRLRQGELIPSVRELARQLAINPNTVARAYRQLQDEQILETVRGQGMRMTKGAVRRCRTDRAKLISSRLKEVLLEARQSGMQRQDVCKILDREMNKFPESVEDPS